jgi:hypothetical protein
MSRAILQLDINFALPSHQSRKVAAKLNSQASPTSSISTALTCPIHICIIAIAQLLHFCAHLWHG